MSATMACHRCGRQFPVGPKIKIEGEFCDPCLADYTTLCEQQRQEREALIKELGHTPTMQDPEYWQLAERHRDQYNAWRNGGRSRAARRPTSATPPGDVPRGPGGVEVALISRCEHCGAPTKGGRFVAGHDAKLKGELKRAGEAGDLDAVVELLARNWPTHTLKVNPKYLQLASAKLDGVSGAWLQARCDARRAAGEFQPGEEILPPSRYKLPKKKAGAR